ncbi:MAG: topoisomerase DNA-binding C4 zinc finger domain-containing protein [Acidobacteriota bacterium]|nr:topoisomerase DNA-binding C4 zinc finger domain-containing protein [Acidobacteriota bacterium]
MVEKRIFQAHCSINANGILIGGIVGYNPGGGQVIDTFSHSALTAFDNCPLAFRFRYLDKRPEAFVTVETHLGRVVHEALFQAYRTPGGAGSIPAAMLETLYRQLWEKEDVRRLHIARQDASLEEYFQAGREMLLAYHRRVMGGDSRPSMGLEQDFRLELDPHTVFRGVVDRIARQESGILRVIDYKTGRSGDPLDSMQLPAYALFAFTLTDDESVELCFEDLREQATRTALFPRIRSDEVKQRLLRAIGVIRAAKDFPPRPSPLCRWCGYSPDCPGVAGLTAPAAVVKPEHDIDGSCPECGAPLIRRNGRFGAFLGCSAYPRCRYTLDLNADSADLPGELVCPECGSPLRERKGKFGRFLGCSRYPACRFSRDLEKKDAKA